METNSKNNKALLAVSGVLAIVGVVIWIMQLANGNAAYDNSYPWGIYIAGFFAAVACGTGALIVGGAMQLCGKDVCYKKVSIAALGSFVMAGFFILADLGAPLNVFSMIFTTNFAAPMVADMWVLVICIVISIAGMLTKGNKAVVVAGIVAALALLGVEAWLIVANNIQELWGVTMSASMALLQAVICGLAIVILIGVESTCVKKTLAALLVAFAAITIIDMAAGLAVADRLGEMWAELAASMWFWAGIIIGVVLPVIVLAVKQNAKIAAICAPIGVLLCKLGYIFASEAVPAQDFMTTVAAEVGMMEIAITIGFAFIGVFVYQLLHLGKGGNA